MERNVQSFQSSRRRTTVIYGLTLFIPESANAMRTLVATTAVTVNSARHGTNCDQKTILRRKNFQTMSDEEKDRYMRYVNMSRYESELS